MNRYSPTLVTALLLACAPVAFATPDLSVTGVITPSACTPFLSSAGIIDFGKLPAKDLNKTIPTRLPLATLQLAVMCNGPTSFALQMEDDQKDSSSNPITMFGLGKTQNAENIGNYLIDLKNPVADSAPTTEIHSLDGGNSWLPAAGQVVTPLLMVAFGDQSSGLWAPIPIIQLTADIRVNAQINPAENLTLNQEVPITGKAIIEVQYL
jgi:type 1 fimbria pilin